MPRPNRTLRSPLALAPLALATLATLAGTGCAGPSASAPDDGFSGPITGDLTVAQRPFGTTFDGDRATLFTLRNANGCEATLTDFGATLVSLSVPDRDGKFADVVLGFDDVAGYESDANQYFGATIGRVANRVADGTFEIGRRRYQLATNNGQHHLHGGVNSSLDKVLWHGEEINGQSVRFLHESRAGSEGYPGTLDVAVTYILTDANELRIDYEAYTDDPTPVNLTNHSYWNLGGHGSGSILDHTLRIQASRYTPTDDTLIPTGDFAFVSGSPLDFQQSRAIGERIEQLDSTPAAGYDHNYVIDHPPGPRVPITVAELRDPKSGRTMTVISDQPGLQFYTGNFLSAFASEQHPGKDGATYGKREALCLETQLYPDSPNKQGLRGWPDAILRPGELYRQTTIHRFGTTQ